MKTILQSSFKSLQQDLRNNVRSTQLRQLLKEFILYAVSARKATVYTHLSNFSPSSKIEKRNDEIRNLKKEKKNHYIDMICIV